MKNYTCGWELKELGYTEIPKAAYNPNRKEMAAFIKMLSDVVAEAACGWDGLRYALMKRNDSDYVESYMVLQVDGHDVRWIPIDGNSKGGNLSVLGENLW